MSYTTRYEEVAKDFPQRDFLDGYHHFRRLELTLHFLDTLGWNLFVLDVGCGDGIQAEKTSEKNRVIGIDISRIRIQRARRKVPKATFIVGDLYHLPFKENVFDVLTLEEVIEHLNKPRKALQELKRVTTLKGHLILDTPSKSNIIDNFMRFLGKEPSWGLVIDRTHIRFYDEATLRKILSYCGFNVVDVRGGPCLRYDIFYLPFLRSLTWSRWGWWFFRITDKILGNLPIIKNLGAIQVYLCKSLK